MSYTVENIFAGGNIWREKQERENDNKERKRKK